MGNGTINIDVNENNSLDPPLHYAYMNSHQWVKADIAGSVLNSAMGGRQSQHKPIPTWLVKTHNFVTPAGANVAASVQMYLDYTIKVKVKCRANHHLPTYTLTSWGS